jgi:hypothetical protein
MPKKKMRNPPSDPEPTVENVEIESRGETTVETSDVPPVPPQNKTIHRRRPLPPVPDSPKGEQ